MTSYTAGIDRSEYGNGFKYTYIAYENLTKGEAVMVTTTANNVVKTTGNGVFAIGIAAETTTSGSPVLVLGSGCKVQTTASLTAGTVYAPAASGAVGAKGAASDQDFCVCEDGTASASIIRIL